MPENAKRDQNFVPTLLGVSSVDGESPVPVYANPVTHRLLVDLPGGSGSVTDVSVVSANGFAGTVATSTTTPAITLSTTVTGLLVSNGTSLAAAVSGTDIKTVNGTSLLGAGNVAVTAAPGGSDTQVQYNNAGALAGITGLTTNGTYVTLTAPRFADGGFIADQNGNEMLAFNSNASAVNYLEVENGATGNPPHLRSKGDDTNIGLHLVPKGTGEVSVCDATDETKRMRFNVANNTTNVITTLRSNSTVARTIDLPDATGTVALTSNLTNLVTGPVSATDNAVAIYNSTTGKVIKDSTVSLASGALAPITNDTVTLGSGTLKWSDLFLAEGGVINWDNGDATLTQVGDVVTLAGADLKVSSPGNVTTSVATVDATQTLTNKRITKRVGSTTSSATPTINTDNVDAYHLTAQTVDITSFTTNLSGTPTDFQQLRISVTGTAARAITWGASFANGPVALPTTTVTTTRLDVLFEWDSVTSKWRCMASGSTV